MIKVNLLNNIETPPAGVDAPSMSTSAASMGSSGDEQDKRLGLLKLLVVILPIVGLHMYQGQIIDKKKKAIASVQQQLRRYQEVNKQQGTLAEEIERIKDEEKLFRKRIEVISGLSEGRSRVVQAMDAVQTLIPEKIWLTRVEVVRKQFILEGYSISDLELSGFIQSLQDSRFFMDVNLRASAEAKLEGGNFKEFEVSFVLREGT